MVHRVRLTVHQQFEGDVYRDRIRIPEQFRGGIEEGTICEVAVDSRSVLAEIRGLLGNESQQPIVRLDEYTRLKLCLSCNEHYDFALKQVGFWRQLYWGWSASDAWTRIAARLSVIGASLGVLGILVGIVIAAFPYRTTWGGEESGRYSFHYSSESASPLTVLDTSTGSVFLLTIPQDGKGESKGLWVWVEMRPKTGEMFVREGRKVRNATGSDK